MSDKAQRPDLVVCDAYPWLPHSKDPACQGPRPGTAFDHYLAERMREPRFAAQYWRERIALAKAQGTGRCR